MAENCKVDDCRQRDLHYEIERLRDALDVIAGFGKVPLNSEWEAGLRDIIRAMTDCARTALEHPSPTGERSV